MGVMGSLFPQPKITEDADAAADGQKFRLGPIDLESGVVQLQPVRRPAQASEAADSDDPADPPADDVAGS
jgi:hypothetical protein